MRLLELLTKLEKERARLERTGLDQDADVEVAVELAGTTRVAPMRNISLVGDLIRLNGRP